MAMTVKRLQIVESIYPTFLFRNFVVNLDQIVAYKQ